MGSRDGWRMSLRVALVMTTALVAFTAVSCGLLGRHPGLAMTTFNEVYETEGTLLDDCKVCHARGRALNSYGQAVREAIPADADPKTDDQRVRWLREAMLAVAADDSDGDGYPNGAEIDVRTFPGDRNDAPTAIGDGQ